MPVCCDPEYAHDPVGDTGRNVLVLKMQQQQTVDAHARQRIDHVL